MRFLIISSDYKEYLDWLYAQNPGLDKKPYTEQIKACSDTLFSAADFYAANLRKLGHEAYSIHANNEYMQRAWAREHGLKDSDFRWRYFFYRGIVSSLNRFNHRSWFYNILAEQIKLIKPDVLINQVFDGLDSNFLKEMKPYVRLLIGQIAAPFSKKADFSSYDLILSAHPDFVDYFRQNGWHSELNRLAFEPSILERLESTKRQIPVSFVGSLTMWHKERIRLLEYVNKHVDLKVWSRGCGNSPLRQCCKNHAWGIDMYKILNDSKITLNNHIGVAGGFAGNMRLFEATGVGTLLITDWKKNLQEMFDIGKEVAAYHTPEECVELIKYYLNNEDERNAAASAGQHRTLQQHTYYHRMQELIGIIKKCS